MKIEILHSRDPEGECFHSVWIDGTQLPTMQAAAPTIEDIDPGHGYEAHDWVENIAGALAADYSPGFRRAVLDELMEAYDSQYIGDKAELAADCDQDHQAAGEPGGPCAAPYGDRVCAAPVRAGGKHAVSYGQIG